MTIYKDASIEIQNIRLHYLIAGQGPLVILLHGFPQCSYAWRYQIQELSKHFTVVVPDLRGYGESDKPSGIQAYDIETLSKDILGLMQALGYQKAHLVGHDWGGAIAWHLAIHYPQNVDRLVVINCPHPVKFSKALRSDYRQIKKSWYVFFFQIPFVPEILFKLFSKNLIKKTLRGTSLKPNAFSDQDLEIYRRQLLQPGAFRAALNYYRAAFRKMLCRTRTESKHAKIQAPTLLLWGEADQALGKNLTLDMERFFQNDFKIQYIPDCSHWVMEEAPDTVNTSILKHLCEKS